MTVDGAEGRSDNPRARIGRGVVALLKQAFGRGPVKAETHYLENLVVIVLYGGFSVVEATLKAAGETQAVRDQRAVFHRVMRDRFVELIEAETGRKVVSFMAATDQDGDVSAELFLLEPKAS